MNKIDGLPNNPEHYKAERIQKTIKGGVYPSHHIGTKVTYNSFTVTLTIDNMPAQFEGGNGWTEVYLTVHSGLGFQHYHISETALDCTVHELLTLSDRALFAVLFSIYQADFNARLVERELTANQYQKAFAFGKLKKSTRKGVTRVWIIQ